MKHQCLYQKIQDGIMLIIRGLFRYGKGLGCDFLNKKCFSNNKTNFKREFCLTLYEERYSVNNIDKGDCFKLFYSYSFRISIL